MSNGDCWMEGRHSVKEPLILAQLEAISALQHIHARTVMIVQNVFFSWKWFLSKVQPLFFDVIPQRGDRDLNMGYWVSGDPVELSFPA